MVETNTEIIRPSPVFAITLDLNQYAFLLQCVRLDQVYF